MSTAASVTASSTAARKRNNSTSSRVSRRPSITKSSSKSSSSSKSNIKEYSNADFLDICISDYTKGLAHYKENRCGAGDDNDRKKDGDLEVGFDSKLTCALKRRQSNSKEKTKYGNNSTIINSKTKNNNTSISNTRRDSSLIDVAVVDQLGDARRLNSQHRYNIDGILEGENALVDVPFFKKKNQLLRKTRNSNHSKTSDDDDEVRQAEAMAFAIAHNPDMSPDEIKKLRVNAVNNDDNCGNICSNGDENVTRDNGLEVGFVNRQEILNRRKEKPQQYKDPHVGDPSTKLRTRNNMKENTQEEEKEAISTMLQAVGLAKSEVATRNRDRQEGGRKFMRRSSFTDVIFRNNNDSSENKEQQQRHGKDQQKYPKQRRMSMTSLIQIASTDNFSCGVESYRHASTSDRMKKRASVSSVNSEKSSSSSVASAPIARETGNDMALFQRDVVGTSSTLQASTKNVTIIMNTQGAAGTTRTRIKRRSSLPFYSNYTVDDGTSTRPIGDQNSNTANENATKVMQPTTKNASIKMNAPGAAATIQSRRRKSLSSVRSTIYIQGNSRTNNNNTDLNSNKYQSNGSDSSDGKYQSYRCIDSVEELDSSRKHHDAGAYHEDLVAESEHKGHGRYDLLTQLLNEDPKASNSNSNSSVVTNLSELDEIRLSGHDGRSPTNLDDILNKSVVNASDDFSDIATDNPYHSKPSKPNRQGTKQKDDYHSDLSSASGCEELGGSSHSFRAVSGRKFPSIETSFPSYQRKNNQKLNDRNNSDKDEDITDFKSLMKAPWLKDVRKLTKEIDSKMFILGLESPFRPTTDVIPRFSDMHTQMRKHLKESSVKELNCNVIGIRSSGISHHINGNNIKDSNNICAADALKQFCTSRTSEPPFNLMDTRESVPISILREQRSLETTTHRTRRIIGPQLKNTLSEVIERRRRPSALSYLDDKEFVKVFLYRKKKEIESFVLPVVIARGLDKRLDDECKSALWSIVDDMNNTDKFSEELYLSVIPQKRTQSIQRKRWSLVQDTKTDDGEIQTVDIKVELDSFHQLKNSDHKEWVLDRWNMLLTNEIQSKKHEHPKGPPTENFFLDDIDAMKKDAALQILSAENAFESVRDSNGECNNDKYYEKGENSEVSGDMGDSTEHRSNACTTKNSIVFYDIDKPYSQREEEYSYKDSILKEGDDRDYVNAQISIGNASHKSDQDSTLDDDSSDSDDEEYPWSNFIPPEQQDSSTLESISRQSQSWMTGLKIRRMMQNQDNETKNALDKSSNHSKKNDDVNNTNRFMDFIANTSAHVKRQSIGSYSVRNPRRTSFDSFSEAGTYNSSHTRSSSLDNCGQTASRLGGLDNSRRSTRSSRLENSNHSRRSSGGTTDISTAGKHWSFSSDTHNSCSRKSEKSTSEPKNTSSDDDYFDINNQSSSSEDDNYDDDGVYGQWVPRSEVGLQAHASICK